MGVKGLRRFTAEEDATIIRLIRMGKSAKEMSEILARNPKSVRNRIDWMKDHGITAPESGTQTKIAAATAEGRTVVTVSECPNPIGEIRDKIAELKDREAELTAKLDDVRDEMAGIYAQLRELIGAVS